MKIFLLVLLTCSIFLLTACTLLYPNPQNNQNTNHPNGNLSGYYESNMDEISQEIDDLILSTPEYDLSAYIISAVWATYSRINAFDDVIDFSEHGNGHQNIIIIPGIVITNFAYISIGLCSDNFYLYEDNVLFTLDELLPEQPFLVNWQEDGYTPHKGVRFVDHHNRTRYFFITTDISDGNILMIEFEPGESIISG